MSKAVMQKGFITRLHGGEPDAIRDIFQAFYKPLRYFAFQLIANEQEAEDIAADSISKLLDKRGDFDNILSIRSFLYITTRNACSDFFRSEQRHDKSHSEIRYLQRETEEQADNENSKERVLQEIYERVEHLPPRCRKVFKLMFFGGLSTAEVAQRMGITARTVLNHKTRAISLLKGTFIGKDMLPIILFIATALSLLLS